MAYPAWEDLGVLGEWADQSALEAWEQPTDPATLPNWEGEAGTMTFEGDTYNVVGIGGQKWTKENLKWLPSVNEEGDLSNLTPKYYVLNYDGTNVAAAKATTEYEDFGVLYNQSADIEITSNLASPWRVPSPTDWNNMASYIGSSVGDRLKAQPPDFDGSDLFGFGALPGGLATFTFDLTDNGYYRRASSTVLTIFFLGFDYAGIVDEGPAGASVRLMSNWKVDDQVQHNGFAYKCLVDDTLEEPGTGNDWEQLIYSQEDKVTHIDAAWQSDIDTNISEPPTNWTNISYQTGDEVQHIGQFWQSETDDNLSEPPTNWTDIGYKTGDRVLHNGSLWEAQVDDTTEEPGTGTDWEQVLAEVITNAVTGILIDGATLNATVTETGQGDILKRGFQVSTTSGEPYEITVEESGSFTDGAYSLNVSDLGRNTYFVRAFVENIDGIAYGDEVTFTTGQAPVVLNQFVTNRESQTATLNADIDDGNRAPTQQGFVYGTTSLPEPAVDPAISDYSNVVFTIPADITGLNPNQTYYYRAFAENEFGLVYGVEQPFTTVSFPGVTSVENDVANLTSLTNKVANNNGIINKTANPTNLNNV